jgi:hypothetical protein
MFTQLSPPIPMDAIGRGHGLAIACIDYGPDWDLWWVIILDDSGEIWTLRNQDVRGVKNITMGRRAERASGE